MKHLSLPFIIALYPIEREGEKMGKKAKLKQMKKNGQTYHLLHYTKDSYLEVFPEADLSDYHAYLLSSEISRVKEQEKKNNLYISTIRHVVIGDDYFRYLEEQKLENTYENRMTYAESLRDEQVEALWEEFKNDAETRFIPFAVVSERKELEDKVIISREEIEEAKSILTQTFQAKKDEISIHPKFLRHEETHENFLAKTTLSVVKEEKESVLVRFLAVSVKEIRPAIQTRKDFERGRWTEQKVPHISLTTWAEHVWSELPESAEIISVPGLLASTQTKDFSDAFQVNLQKMNV